MDWFLNLPIWQAVLVAIAALLFIGITAAFILDAIVKLFDQDR